VQRSGSEAPPRRRARGGTLVVGGGFACATVARELGKRGATIVNPDNFMLFTPILPEAASGMVEPRHAVVPLRQMCPHAELMLGSVQSLDLVAQTADVNAGDAGRLTIEWDNAVIAVGAVSRLLPIPGLAEYGREFKNLADAISLRNHVLRELEAADAEPNSAEIARHLTFVFVGAGYAGVEALAELADLVSDALPLYPRLRHAAIRWVLVDAAPSILPEIPSRLGAYASEELLQRGFEIRTSTMLAAATEGAVTLSDGTTIPTHTLVWTAGVKPNPVVSSWGLPLDERGRVGVDPTLQIKGYRHLWALGDCAAVPNSHTPGRTDPPTSQHALRQARRLAHNLHAPPQPYGYRMLGQVATLGSYKGIADILGIPLRGFPGWFITRSYHLYQLPVLSRRLRVVTDWTTSLLFHRDTAELSLIGRNERNDR
jgi:NADH dehydrogenase